MGKRWIIVLGLVGLAVVLVIAAGWILLTSAELSNSRPAIALQRLYLQQFRDFDPDYAALPSKAMTTQIVEGEEDGESFMYLMAGTFEKIDPENQILFLLAKDGKQYGFQYRSARPEQLTVWEQQADGSPALEKTIDTASLAPGEFMMAQWQDERKLPEILAEAEANERKLLNPYTQGDDFERMIVRQK
ncbi:MAG: hypothetical protein ACOYYU_19840 [Chloroflexota bacterium]